MPTEGEVPPRGELAIVADAAIGRKRRSSGQPIAEHAWFDQGRGVNASCRRSNIIGGAKFICKLINENRP